MNRGLLAAGAAAAGYYAYRALKPRYDFRDKHVLLTGGSRGLGLLLARRFAAKGARLSLCSRHADELARAGTELSNRGAKVLTYACDLTQEAEVRAFVDAGVRANGPVDVLIHNAGVIQVGPLAEMTVEDFRESLAIHLWAALHAARAVIPEMQRRKQGRIVNIASIGGKIAVPHLVPYAVGKFALVGLSDGLRAELAQDGIVVTTVCPGLMRTGSHLNAEFKGQHDEEYAWFATGNSIPGMSINADRAAGQIIDACAIGDAELVISLAAKVGVVVRALAPNLTATLAGLANHYIQPAPGGIGQARLKGKDSRGKLPAIVTTLTDRAARANNEA